MLLTSPRKGVELNSIELSWQSPPKFWLFFGSIIEPAATFTSQSKYRDMFFLGGVDTKIFLLTDLLTSSNQKQAGRHTASIGTRLSQESKVFHALSSSGALLINVLFDYYSKWKPYTYLMISWKSQKLWPLKTSIQPPICISTRHCMPRELLEMAPPKFCLPDNFFDNLGRLFLINLFQIKIFYMLYKTNF